MIVYQGEDKTVNLTLKDAEGTPINLSSGYDNIVVFISNADGSVLEKYSRETTAGWQEINTDDQALGLLSFHISSATTKLASCGKKYIEVLVQKNDLDMDDDKYDSILKSYLFTIAESVTATQTLP